jgi:hypothetical protein
MTYREERELKKKSTSASEKIKLIRGYREEGKTAQEIAVIMDCHIDHVRRLWNKGIAISKQEAGVIARREAKQALLNARSPEQVAIDEAKKAAQKQANSKCSVGWNRENEIGVTAERYNQIFLDQKGKCAICGIHQDDLKTALCLDHCHKTQAIRGLLCSKCNLGLGYFKDNTDSLAAAISYLQIPREIEPERVLSFDMFK